MQGENDRQILKRFHGSSFMVSARFINPGSVNIVEKLRLFKNSQIVAPAV
jgi:hypothetical protein